jgi:hypothetical protein
MTPYRTCPNSKCRRLGLRPSFRPEIMACPRCGGDTIPLQIKTTRPHL